MARDEPALLLAFDVLRHTGTDVVDRPLRDRRVVLTAMLAAEHGAIQLITQTDAIEEAEDWLRLLPTIEGVVAKRVDGRYAPGQREWIKVKRQRTADCVVMGIAGDLARPWLVLGLRHEDGRVHHFGLARPADAVFTPAFAALVGDAGPEESPIRSRWQPRCQLGATSRQPPSARWLLPCSTPGVG